jgi:hypothetical protein
MAFSSARAVLIAGANILFISLIGMWEGGLSGSGKTRLEGKKLVMYGRPTLIRFEARRMLGRKVLYSDS